MRGADGIAAGGASDKKQKFDSEALVVEANKACQLEVRMDVLTTSKTFYVKFPEKNPWAPKSPEAAKEDERSLEKSLASSGPSPAKDRLLQSMRDNPVHPLVLHQKRQR